MTHDEILDQWRTRARRLEDDIARAFPGQPDAGRLLTIAAFARGHVLLDGPPGAGKGALVRTFSRALDGPVESIAGTPDLAAEDLLYEAVPRRDGSHRFRPGPLVRHRESLAALHVEGIDTLRPEALALLLRVLAGQPVRAFGRECALPHVLVFAERDRSSVGAAQTLPAAACDRFLFEIALRVPDDATVQRRLVFSPAGHDPEALLARLPAVLAPVSALTAVATAIQVRVQVSERLQDYVLQLWQVTRRPALDGPEARPGGAGSGGSGGPSPRAMRMLVRAARVAAWLEGRDYVTPEDVRAVWVPALRHRPLPASGAAGADALLASVLEHVPIP
jgi:MoxR-like ATPase